MADRLWTVVSPARNGLSEAEPGADDERLGGVRPSDADSPSGRQVRGDGVRRTCSSWAVRAWKGRWSYTFHDALRRVAGTRDAAGRTTRLEYSGGSCVSCGGGKELTGLIDANGNPTRWEYDERGRKAKEIRTNGAEYLYSYTATGQLKTTTDPKGNVKSYVYNRDGSLAGIQYAVATGTSPPPNVSFTYDEAYNRVLTVTDGTGTTRYSYHTVGSPPTLGAGKLRSVDGPLADDTIEYGYDELGRVSTRQIGSGGNTQTQAFDALGRLATLGNALGSFTYTYEGVTGRPASLTYPNGQQTTWAYYDNLGDHRLREIHNKRPGGATLSRFEYTYDQAGNILTWLQQADSDPAKAYVLGYDKTDQLTSAVLQTTDPVPAILKRYYYSYDPAGNRTAEQIDDAVTGASHNHMNQLVSQQAGGALAFKGTVSEPANVAVGGHPATVTADNRFEGQAVVPSGTGQVAVTATDPSGNVRTSTYQVSQGATSKSFTYDLNGNTTSDGTRTFEWDAENRLVAVKEGATTIASFTYNHRGIRTSKTTAAGTISYVLEAGSVVEERFGGGVRKHHQGPGLDTVLAMQDDTGVVSYLLRDHLGSIREQVDATGTTVTLRRDYDPWGNMSAGASTNGWAYTGREWDAETELYYYRARYYGSGAGRFTSEDPIALAGGPNLYAYIGGRVTVGTDPLGYVIHISLTTAPSQYNVATTCSGDAGGTCYKRTGGKLGPCRKKDSCYGFNVTVDVRIRKEFTVTQAQATAPGSSADSPGLSLEEHEDLHVQDFKVGLADSVINSMIKTEGFGSPQECMKARKEIIGRIDAFIDGVALGSHLIRDRW